MSLNDYKGKALVCTSEEFQVNNELWQSLITVIEVTPDMFHNMGTQSKPIYYPKKQLTNIIGSGMGIEFGGESGFAEVLGDKMTKPDGTTIRKVTGYQCTKIGRKRKPDGDFMPSSPCTYEFNWEDRAEEDFLKDMDMIGQFWPDKNPKAKYNFPDNPGKQAVMRRKHVLELKKFAAQRASTGAELLAIRELTGMPTGFKPNELINNKIVVSQVCKSDELQKKEANARLQNIITGGNIAKQIDKKANLLTGNKVDSQEDFKKNTSPGDETQNQEKDLSEKDLKEEIEEEELSPLEKEFYDLLDSDESKKDPGFKKHYQDLYKDNHNDGFLEWAIKDIPYNLNKENK